MRQLWIGLIVIIAALALGVGAAFGASILVRNRIANLPSIRINRSLPSGQPGNNQRQYNNPGMQRGGQHGFGPFNFRNPGNRGPMMGPGGRGFGNFFNCPVPNQGQNPGNGQGQQPNNCPPFGRFNQPGNPNDGNGNGPY